MPLATFSATIIAAPMAGGTSTPSFVQAVHSAGGLGFLAAGYKTVQGMTHEIQVTRATGARFGMNVFVPDRTQLNPPPSVLAGLEAYRSALATDAADYGLELPQLRLDDDDAWQAKIDALLEDPVELVSFTFGLPGAGIVAALKHAGSAVIATVTNAAEAEMASEQGFDALVVQHGSAGGHSGTFWAAGSSSTSRTTAELVTEVRSAVGLPLIAAGGIADAEAVKSVLAAGAEAAQLGTALLRTNESGARQLHKDALSDPAYTQTQLTRAFTGRQARALVNEFVRDHPDAPEGYPVIHHLTAPLRAAAAAAGDAGRVNLWAGTGWRAARTGPVAEVVSGILSGL